MIGGNVVALYTFGVGIEYSTIFASGKWVWACFIGVLACVLSWSWCGSVSRDFLEVSDDDYFLNGWYIPNLGTT